MNDGSTIRLNKVLRELNISLDKAIDFLTSKGHDVDARPTTKISEEIYLLLQNEFLTDMSKKVAFNVLGEEMRREKEAIINLEHEQEVSRLAHQKRADHNEKIKAKAKLSRPRMLYKGNLDINKKTKPVIDENKVETLQEVFLGDKVEIFDNTKKEKDNDQNQNIEINRELDFSPLQHFDIDELEEENNNDELEVRRNKEIWRKYILAQEKIIDYKSLPIAISSDDNLSIDNNILRLEVDQNIFKKIFKDEIEKVFKLNDFNYDDDHILQDLKITDQISLDDLKNLKESAEGKYIEFNEHPILEGGIKAKGKNYTTLNNLLGEVPDNYLFNKEGLLFLTKSQREEASKFENINFNSCAGAVYQINPTISFLLSVIYKNPNVHQVTTSRFKVFGGQLHKSLEDSLIKEINLQRKRYYLNFQYPEDFEITKKVEEIEKRHNVVFPKPIDHCIQFRIEANSKENYNDESIRLISLEEQKQDFRREVIRIKKAVDNYFPKASINITYDLKYSYDLKKLENFFSQKQYLENRFWDRLYQEIHGNQFQISSDKGTISFDFECFDDLDTKKEILKGYNFFYLNDYRDDHKYKFNIKFETGLHDLQKKLNISTPSLVTRLISNGQELKFYKHYKSGNKAFVRDHLTNVVREHIDNEIFDVYVDDTFQEKYLCLENFDLKVEQEEEKLSKLKREMFYFGDKKNKSFLGRLQKVDYPNLYFFVDDDMIEEVQGNLWSKGIIAIFPDLKGERDKILRLTRTIQKLNSDIQLPNNNAKDFLFDSSKAKPIEDIEYLLEPSSDAWKTFEENMLSNYLNNSQKEAIIKSLYAEELMLIQGPPGTGKSTAIAEIIWHHILRNPKERVLLTSETNLAVDNAMDRIKNDNNNIVKPIRFGNDDKLATEGLFYSYPTIQLFKTDCEFDQPNAVSHWITNISNRVATKENENVNNALIQWKSHLLDKDEELRTVFCDKYLEHANLIGATGSSMGKLNSEGRYTSFFHSYLKIFERNKYLPEINWKACDSVNIVFDTVVMDEASKATPPELAMPVLYGKKAIIVGDHRQLPPMVDGEEIKDTLFSIGEKDLALTLSRDEFKKSQFERLFKNDSIDSSIKGTFNTQYRMHPAINNVIEQFYIEDGGLKCGLPLDESNHTSFNQISSRYHGLEFKNLIKPETHVIWVDVDSPEIKEGTSRANLGEVNAIDLFLQVIQKSKGIETYNLWLNTQRDEEKEVGIISFYGKQINHIERMLRNNHKDLPIRLSSVDKFQGMERNIIIVSLVRSNKIASVINQPLDFDLYGELGYPTQKSLGFAESPNRLNVALSRAKRLLVIVGNKNHFCKKEIYKNVYESIEGSANGKIIMAEQLKNEILAYE